MRVSAVTRGCHTTSTMQHPIVPHPTPLVCGILSPLMKLLLGPSSQPICCGSTSHVSGKRIQSGLRPFAAVCAARQVRSMPLSQRTRLRVGRWSCPYQVMQMIPYRWRTQNEVFHRFRAINVDIKTDPSGAGAIHRVLLPVVCIRYA